MRKDITLGIVAIGAILSGIVFFAITKSPPAETTRNTAGIVLSDSNYTEHTPNYDIVANYATSTQLSGSANTVAVASMKKFVGDIIAQFKDNENSADLTTRSIPVTDFSQERKETLKIVYLIASSPRTISYIFTVYEDTLGTHGNMFFRTFTFDITSGAELSISDIFLPDSNYLETLSELSRSKLPAVIGKSADTQMITNGTTPEAKNFANFFFDNKDFVILFDPYAVAPYATGPQTLRIPINEITNILNPTYRQ